MAESFRPLASGLALVACALLTACASQQKKADADLAEIVGWLPGRYDNLEQVQQLGSTGKNTHVGLAVSIVPIYVPTFGDHVFYLQESAADDPRRITMQRLLSFKATEEGKVVETLYTLADPGRWRSGAQNADLFKGMMYTDATPLAGCDLSWKKDGTKYTAANAAGGCRTTMQALGGGVRLELRAELAADELSLSELPYNASGQLLQGDPAEPFYRYRKRSGP